MGRDVLPPTGDLGKRKRQYVQVELSRSGGEDLMERSLENMSRKSALRRGQEVHCSRSIPVGLSSNCGAYLIPTIRTNSNPEGYSLSDP
nr:hypothetical protein Iba_chr03fCG3350 [Ipomoea batatas]